MKKNKQAVTMKMRFVEIPPLVREVIKILEKQIKPAIVGITCVSKATFAWWVTSSVFAKIQISAGTTMGAKKILK